MRNLTQDNITQAVIARMADTPDARLKEIMTSLVQHLHAFAREVKLTEAEWFQGIQFLTQVGHITDDQRQEFILLSDTLGLSMLTVAMNQDKPQGCTEATVFGPFYVEGAPTFDLGDDLETLTRQFPTQTHRMLARLQAQSTAKTLGAKSWKDVLKIRWRLSGSEANRRLSEAAVLGPRRALAGQPLHPELPATAAAQAQGLINGGHVSVLRKSMAKIPSFVDASTRTRFTQPA